MWQHKSQSTWASDSGVGMSSQINLRNICVWKTLHTHHQDLESCRLNKARIWIPVLCLVWVSIEPSSGHVLQATRAGIAPFLQRCCQVFSMWSRDNKFSEQGWCEGSFEFWHFFKPGHWGYRPLEIIRNRVPVRTISELRPGLGCQFNSKNVDVRVPCVKNVIISVYQVGRGHCSGSLLFLKECFSDFVEYSVAAKNFG